MGKFVNNERGITAGRLVVADAYSQKHGTVQEIDQKAIFEKFKMFYERLRGENKDHFRDDVGIQIASQLVTAFVISREEEEVFERFYKYYRQLNNLNFV